MAESKADGWNEGFRERLAHLIDRAGGLKQAADLVGYSSDAVINWRSGKSKIPMVAAGVLCRSAGKTIDWLAFGDVEEKAPGFHKDSVVEAVNHAAQYILKASEFFETNGPDEISMAIAKRAIFLLESEDRSSTPESDRLTHRGSE